MDLSNIEKIININNDSHAFVDKNEKINITNPLDEVNKYLSEGWILLSIDARQNGDYTSYINQYILGFPKSNSSK